MDGRTRSLRVGEREGQGATGKEKGRVFGPRYPEERTNGGAGAVRAPMSHQGKLHVHY